jgi:hypothetical protein
MNRIFTATETRIHDLSEIIVPSEYPEMASEFGSEYPVQFLTAENVVMTDAEGDIVNLLCKCGKSATTALIGNESFLGLCSDCAYVRPFER